MQDIVTQRFSEFLKSQGISQNQIGKMLDIKPQTINNQLLRSGVSVDVLSRLFDKNPSLSAEWLMRGEGPMWRAEVTGSPQTAGENSVVVGHGSAVVGDVTNAGAAAGEVENLKNELKALQSENTLLRDQLAWTQKMFEAVAGKGQQQ